MNRLFVLLFGMIVYTSCDFINPDYSKDYIIESIVNQTNSPIGYQIKPNMYHEHYYQGIIQPRDSICITMNNYKENRSAAHFVEIYILSDTTSKSWIFGFGIANRIELTENGILEKIYYYSNIIPNYISIPKEAKSVEFEKTIVNGEFLNANLGEHSYKDYTLLDRFKEYYEQ